MVDEIFAWWLQVAKTWQRKRRKEANDLLRGAVIQAATLSDMSVVNARSPPALQNVVSAGLRDFQ